MVETMTIIQIMTAVFSMGLTLGHQPSLEHVHAHQYRRRVRFYFQPGREDIFSESIFTSIRFQRHNPSRLHLNEIEKMKC